MSQYQAYQKPEYPHDPNSYGQQPHGVPQYTMAQPQQPGATYSPQQPMVAEKQAHAHAMAFVSRHGQSFGKKWLFGLFDCCLPCNTCCLGFWCPCVLFGKTYAREHGEGETSGCSMMCCAWYCAAQVGFNSCLQGVIRGQQRERYGIEGGGCGDCCTAFWCGCCALIQEEKESVVRVTGMDPKTKIAYQPINGDMKYQA